jgi:hypothetical protein
VNLGLDGLEMLRLWENDDQELRESELMGELKAELSEEVVGTIATARTAYPILKKCENRAIKEKWGPVLVQRQRRGQDNGIPIMKKTMEVKKKKNLEFLQGNPFATLLQGNPFATLQPENLNEIWEQTVLNLSTSLVIWLLKTKNLLMTLLMKILKFCYLLIYT